jgi:cephalosporin hydroxylase
VSIEEDYQARVEVWSDIQGHMAYLREEASHWGRTIIELGTRTGNSTVSFLAGVAGLGHVWSCDLDDPQVPAEWHDLPNWHFRRGDDMSPETLAWMPEKCDLLFIDTSHEFRHTLAELRAYAPRVKPHGLILMHDTQFFPPASDAGLPMGAVARALDLYCAQNKLRWENRPGFFGLGIVRC